MRPRTIVAALAALSTLLTVAPASAEDGPTSSSTPGSAGSVGSVGSVGSGLDALPGVPAAAAQATLDRAREALAADPVGARVDPTLALRDLRLALPSLEGSQRRQARALLARPTDGNQDPYLDGYDASAMPATRTCSGHFCVHRVTTTDDRASAAYASSVLSTMNAVWDLEVGRLGYRTPPKDKKRGGNGKVDVYLKQLAPDGLYGYCASEGRKRVAPAYCVLDNDFTDSVYSAHGPADNLKVTAAHEFFHVVQFGYDAHDDGWLMEASATWMEEQFADAVDDNRQYLPDGQVNKPQLPLDAWNRGTFGVSQYANWVFFQYLADRFGPGVVKQVWQQAGAFKGAGGTYSTDAVVRTLRTHGGFTKVFADYAAGNTEPGTTYAEGAAWSPRVPRYGRMTKRWTLSRKSKRAHATVKIDHLASKNIRVSPASGLSGKRWTGRVVVAGPGRATSPAVVLRIHRTDGTEVAKRVKLNRKGHGRATFALSSAKLRNATITLANASTRFRCHRSTMLSCAGKAKDNHRRFEVTVRAFKK